MGLDPALAGEDYCYLTTIGRVSGNPHEIEIWFAHREVEGGDRLYMLSGGRASADWVQNLLREPRVSIRIGDRRFEATARVLDETPEAADARELLYDKYQPGYGNDLSSWRDTALPVALDLDGEAEQ